MKAIFILLLLPCSFLPSQFAEASDQNSAVEVLVTDPTVATKNMPKSDFAVQRIDEPTHEILPSARDAILAKAGISTELVNWDHLEKDMLLQRAAFSSEQELLRKYPNISAIKLKNLQKLAKTKNIESNL